MCCFRRLGSIFIVAAAVLLGIVTGGPEGVAADQSLGVTVDAAGGFRYRGRPLRAVGVNYFDPFLRTLRRPDDRSYEEGLRVLAERQIPFIRFAACGFWPADMRLYQEDRVEYFRRLDAFVAAAEREKIGLIPSLFWHLPTVPDLVDEPCNRWGDPASRTHAFMREYTHEVVSRYRNSPAVWGWEFGNEYNLAADLPNAATHRPPVVVKQGTPAERGPEDDLTDAMVRTALTEFARQVRKDDPYRFITSGHAIPRPAAWHMLHENGWTPDTPEQFTAMLLQTHPEPLDVVSVHIYGEAIERLPWTVEAVREKPLGLFVGEFGVPHADDPQAEATEWRAMLQSLEEKRIGLAALWVFDFAHQDGTLNVTAENSRHYQLDDVAELNRRWREEMSADADEPQTPSTTKPAKGPTP